MTAANQRRGRVLLVGVLGLLLSSACRRAPPPPAKPAPAAATVNGVAIPVTRVQAEMDRIRRGSQEGPAQADPKSTPQLARAVLDALIDRTLVLERAQRAGVKVGDAEVQQATDALAESVRKGGESFGTYLARAGETNEQLAEATRERLLAEKYVADETRREVPSTAEVRAFYDTHRGDYEQPEMVHAQEITVRNAEEAKSLLDQLRNGASFDALARQHGTTPDARSGGDLGWFARGTMPREFDDFVFSSAAAKQKLSGVIKTDYGYTVLKVLGKRPARRRPFEEVRADVERRATIEKRSEAERQLLAQLRQQAEIKIDEHALTALK